MISLLTLSMFYEPRDKLATLHIGFLSPYFLHLTMEAPLDISALWWQPSMRDIINLLPPDTFSYREKHYHLNLDNAVLTLPAKQWHFLDCITLGRMDSLGNEEGTEDLFMETISEEVQQDCICRFINATGNIATTMSTCVVCTGTFSTLTSINSS